MTLQNIKLLGSIGVLLTLTGIIPVIGLITPFIGLIMILVSLNHLEKLLDSRNAFSNYLIGSLLPSFGIILVFTYLFNTVGAPVMESLRVGDQQASKEMILQMIENGQLSSDLLLGSLIFLYVIIVAGSFFQAKSLKIIAQKTKKQHFLTTAHLLFWGSVLIILFGLGFLIMLIGSIYLIVSFFNLQEEDIPSLNLDTDIKE